MSSNRRLGPTRYGLAAVSAVAAVGLIASCNAILGFEQGEPAVQGSGGNAAGGGGQGGGAGQGGLGGHGGLGGSAPAAGWSRRLGDWADQFATDVVEDLQGNVVLTGTFGGELDFDGELLHGTTGGHDGFVAKLDAQGDAVWALAFLGSGEDQSRALAVTDQSDIVVVGFFAGDLDLGGATLVADDTYTNLFVASFSGEGEHLWSRSFAGNSSQRAYDVAWDAGAGQIVVAGRFAGTLQMGDSLSAAGDPDVLVAKLAADGTPLWARQFGDDALQAATAVAVAADGSIILAGEFDGTVTFEPDQLTNQGGKDIFLARLDATGAALWGRGFGSAGNEEPFDVAVDSEGNAIICGYFDDTIDFGGDALVSTGQTDIFIAKFDGGGTHLWSHRFGDEAGNQVCHTLTVDSDDSVLAAGRFDGTVNFGGEPLDCGGAGDLFLVRFTASGAHVQSACFGQSGLHIPLGLYATSTHEVLLAGSLGGTADFGHGPLVSEGGDDLLVAKLAL